jgi:hypothetical protein
VWKKALGVPADKDGARARASQLMPENAWLWPLVKHDGRAEAALIAYWGIRTLDLIATGGIRETRPATERIKRGMAAALAAAGSGGDVPCGSDRVPRLTKKG